MLSRPPSLFGASSPLFLASLAAPLALTSCDDDSPVIIDDLSPAAVVKRWEPGMAASVTRKP